MGDLNKLEKIGGLETLIYGDHEKSLEKVVIFHGYGASAADLFELGRVLDPKQKRVWYFPQGFLSLPIAPMMNGYAWFPIDEEAARQSMLQKGGLKYSHLRPPGLDKACDKALQFLQAIDFDPNKGLLGGFSQGSMMAVEMQRGLPQPVRKLMIFSGALVDREGLRSHGQHFDGLQVFQSHGQHDDILPIAGAEALKQELSDQGANVFWQPFSGGHEIPQKAIAECINFLNK